MQVFWKHKCFGNISQLETMSMIGWRARSTNQRPGFQNTIVSKILMLPKHLHMIRPLHEDTFFLKKYIFFLTSMVSYTLFTRLFEDGPRPLLLATRLLILQHQQQQHKSQHQHQHQRCLGLARAQQQQLQHRKRPDARRSSDRDLCHPQVDWPRRYVWFSLFWSHLKMSKNVFCVVARTITSKTKINVVWNFFSLHWPLRGAAPLKKNSTNVDFSLFWQTVHCPVKTRLKLWKSHIVNRLGNFPTGNAWEGKISLRKNRGRIWGGNSGKIKKKMVEFGDFGEIVTQKWNQNENYGTPLIFHIFSRETKN